MSIEKPYQPSPEEIKKAEEIISGEQLLQSYKRERDYYNRVEVEQEENYIKENKDSKINEHLQPGVDYRIVGESGIGYEIINENAQKEMSKIIRQLPRAGMSTKDLEDAESAKSWALFGNYPLYVKLPKGERLFRYSGRGFTGYDQIYISTKEEGEDKEVVVGSDGNVNCSHADSGFELVAEHISFNRFKIYTQNKEALNLFEKKLEPILKDIKIDRESEVVVYMERNAKRKQLDFEGSGGLMEKLREAKKRLRKNIIESIKDSSIKKRYNPDYDNDEILELEYILYSIPEKNKNEIRRVGASSAYLADHIEVLIKHESVGLFPNTTEGMQDLIKFLNEKADELENIKI